MNGRRALAELLTELADSAAAFAGVAGTCRSGRARCRSACRSTCASPRPTQGLEVIGDVPLFRTRTDFDPDPARLEVDWHAVPLRTGGGVMTQRRDPPARGLHPGGAEPARQRPGGDGHQGAQPQPAAHLRDQGHQPRPARARRVHRQRDPHPARRGRREGGERLPPRLHRDHPAGDRGERDQLRPPTPTTSRSRSSATS